MTNDMFSAIRLASNNKFETRSTAWPHLALQWNLSRRTKSQRNCAQHRNVRRSCHLFNRQLYVRVLRLSVGRIVMQKLIVVILIIRRRVNGTSVILSWSFGLTKWKRFNQPETSFLSNASYQDIFGLDASTNLAHIHRKDKTLHFQHIHYFLSSKYETFYLLLESKSIINFLLEPTSQRTVDTDIHNQ